MNVAPFSDHDLVVIGGGIAGLTGALRAAELGLRVVVLEQGKDALYPCNARYSGGIIHAAYHDVTRPANEVVDILNTATRGNAEPSVVKTIATDGRRLIEWLQGYGVRFMRFSQLEAHKWCMAPPRAVAPGLDWKGRGPDTMLRALTEQLRKRGGTIELGIRAISLRMENGRCTGVVANSDSGERLFPAKAVLIADGGFQANLDLLRKHISSNPDQLLQRGAANGQGDGVMMAMAAGAATRDMGAFYGHLLNRAALTNPDCWPYPELDGVVASAILVGADAKRFADEGLGGITVANAIARLADPASTTLICDGPIWDGPGKSARFPANPTMEKYGGTIHRADTLDALAAKAGLPAAQLQASVAEYNAAVAANSVASLSPPRTTEKFKPLPITGGPYIAIPVCVGLTYTMGGIVVDGDGRVQRPDRTAIAGLYAAGTTIGGVEGPAGDGRVAHVGGLVQSVFGLRAAEHAAAAIGAKPVAQSA